LRKGASVVVLRVVLRVVLVVVGVVVTPSQRLPMN
jgi:hypothetical protein